jgi:phosphatidylserine/phosphatidylglycerophosphate/cardiolipin synthase-like enzyme
VYERFDDEDVAHDYLQLLRRGSVVRRLAVEQHEAWRRAVRAKARTDELRIRTWSREGKPATVFAVLPDWTLTRDERERLLRRLSWQRED